MSEHASTPLHQALTGMLDQYFDNLNGAQPHNVHGVVMTAVEKPLLEYIMRRCGGNQSSAAAMLGINRNTLRKRLTEYGLLEQDSLRKSHL